MPAKHICRWCGKLVPIGELCECQKKNRSKSNKYIRSKRYIDNYEFYRSKDWDIIRTAVFRYCMGVDILQWYETGILIPAVNDRVHHIIPVRDDESMKLVFTNLILLSFDTHTRVHVEYNKGINSKKMMQDKLRKALAAWGRYIDSIKE